MRRRRTKKTDSFDDFSSLWEKYALSMNSRILVPLLSLCGRTKNKEELKKAVEKIKRDKIKDRNVLGLAVKVTSQLHGVRAGERLIREFIIHDHYGRNFEETLYRAGLKSHCLNTGDIESFYKKLKSNPKLQTDRAWGYFALLCVNCQGRFLNRFREDFKDAFELPLVQAMMAKAYLLKQHKIELIRPHLEPLEKLLDKPTKIDPLILGVFLSYYMATKNDKLGDLLSKLDLFKLPQKLLPEALKAASVLGDVEKAEKIYAMLKDKSPKFFDFRIRAYIKSGDAKKAIELFNSLPNKTRENYKFMTTTLRALRRPFQERKNFLRQSIENGYGSVASYIELIADYLHGIPEEDSALLREMLPEIEQLGVIHQLKEKNFERILNFCFIAKDRDLYAYYYEKYCHKFSEREELRQKHMRNLELLKKQETNEQ
jgi:hypothetical protein